MKKKIIRISTVPVYMNIVLRDQLKYVAQRYHVIAVTSFDKKHFNEIRQREGVKLYAINMNRSIHLLHDFISLLRLIRLIKNEKPDLIHSHTPKAGLLSMIAGFFCRVPVRMHTVTGMPLLETNGLKQWVLITLEKSAYRLAHRVYPNSYGLKSIILKYKLTSEAKLKVLLNGSTNGVDTEFFDPSLLESKEVLRSRNGIGKEAFVLLFVGRIAREKGIVEMVEAFDELFQKYRHKYEITLVLIGTYEKQYGRLGPEYEKLIDMHTHIRKLGRFDDVRPFYKMSDVFVLPSYREGMPNAVLEASAMGLPSIVTDINGCNEIIEHGLNGLIIQPKNRQDLFEAMERVLCDEEIRSRMAGKSREIVVSKFNRRDVIDAIINEYDRFLNN